MQKIVLITGASSGIGAVTARHLAGLGYTVYAGARDEAGLLGLGGLQGIRPVQLDVTLPEHWQAVYDRLAADCPQGLYALINNAGVGYGGPVEHLALEWFRHQFEVNFFAVIEGTQTLLPLLRRSDQARVINISSLSGRIVTPFLSPYCSSKFALEALSESLRYELAPWNIQVVLIEPSMIQTPIFARSLAWLQEFKASLPAAALRDYGDGIAAYEKALVSAPGKGGQPERVARAIEKALTDPRPRLRWPVGKHAGLAVALRQYLPDGIFEQVMLRFGAVKKDK